jgi:hypothetical protein
MYIDIFGTTACDHEKLFYRSAFVLILNFLYNFVKYLDYNEFFCLIFL